MWKATNEQLAIYEKPTTSYDVFGCCNEMDEMGEQWIHHFLTTEYEINQYHVQIDGEWWDLDEMIYRRHEQMLSPSRFENSELDRGVKLVSPTKIHDSLKNSSYSKHGVRIHYLAFSTDYPIVRRCDEFVPYKDSTKCYVHYQVACSHELTIRLDNFLNRGFPEYKLYYTYKYYSWLRLLEFDAKLECLKNSESFIKMLKRIDEYYIKNPSYAISERLIIGRGPQSYDKISDKSKLHFYGRGLIKYYSLRVLKDEILNHYGQGVLDKFNSDFTTTEISREDFNSLLKIVNKRIVRGSSCYRKKIEHYIGPQCHEDRGSIKMRYSK